MLQYCPAACHRNPLSGTAVVQQPCSNRAATWVTPLKAWEKHLHKNHRFCSNFATSRKVQHTVASPLHGGGQGFESPRLHSGNRLSTRFCSFSRLTKLSTYRV